MGSYINNFYFSVSLPQDPLQLQMLYSYHHKIVRKSSTIEEYEVCVMVKAFLTLSSYFT